MQKVKSRKSAPRHRLAFERMAKPFDVLAKLVFGGGLLLALAAG
jgi:hypothetical protein